LAIGDGDTARPATVRRHSRIGRAWRRFGRSRAVRRALASLAAGYIRLVGRTNRVIIEGALDYDNYNVSKPLIVTTWHGQHLLLPAVRRRDHRMVALFSRHRDGDFNATIAEKLGVETVRGSAARDRSKTIERGGISGFFKLRSALAAGKTAVLIADLSNTVARRAGLGIIKLARASGVPIQPVALASSRRIAIGSSWDRTTINLPFGRVALVTGTSIAVPADATDDDLEQYRSALDEELDRISERALAIADRTGG